MSTLPQAQLDPLIGRLVGSYRVDRKLGEGGMGAVYQLRHPGIGKRLALKVLHAQYAVRPDIVRRFFDEARVVNLIQHPNIVDIIDFAQLDDGRPYLMMEYLDGESLASLLGRERRLAPAAVVELVRPIASALAAAHRAGIVHRDLKPDNVHLVPHEGGVRVKVLDFGIAKLLGDAALVSDPVRGEHTATGVILGTPAYMAPEQALGKRDEIDARTDVYALGVLIFEMLSGRLPIEASSMAELVVQHATWAPRRLCELRPDLPLEWDALVVRALARAPAQRFVSIDQLVAALPGADPATGAASRAGHPSRLIGLGFAGLAIAGVLGSWFLLRPRGELATQVARADAGPRGRGATTRTVPPAPSSWAGTPDASARPAVSGPPAAAIDPTQPRKPPHGLGTAHLRVTASPWAEVLVDGKVRGHTPLDLELPTGRHRVELRNRELGKRKKQALELGTDQQAHLHAAFD